MLLVVFLLILQYASLTYKQVTASQCEIARLFLSSCLLPDNYTEAQVMFGPHHCTLVTDLTVHCIMWYSQKSAGQLQRERVPGECSSFCTRCRRPPVAAGEASSFSWVVFRCGEASSLAAVSLLRQLFFYRVQKAMLGSSSRKPKLTTPGIGGRGRQLFS